jgi:hypothetical protein
MLLYWDSARIVVSILTQFLYWFLWWSLRFKDFSFFITYFLGVNKDHFWDYRFSNYHDPVILSCILIICPGVVETVLLFEPSKIKITLKART